MRQPSSATSSFNWPWMSRHSRMRLNERKCSRQASCSLRLDFPCSSAPSKNFQSFSQERKSDFSSLNCFCASSAAAARSLGRCRGSCTESAAAMTSTSRSAFSNFAARTMRPMRGSTGSLASCLPVSVSSLSSSTAPSSASSAYPSWTAFGERGLRDVGREHDAPAAVRLEYALLLLRREPREQGQDLGVRRVVFPQRLRRLPDFALARQENEDVALTLARQLLRRVADRLVQIVVFVPGLDRVVTDLHRVEAPGNLDDGKIGRASCRERV